MTAAGTVQVKSGIVANTVQHSPEGSEFALADGTAVRAKLIVDCSGHRSPLVQRDGVHDPGYQIAYGIECEVAGVYSWHLICSAIMPLATVWLMC